MVRGLVSIVVLVPAVASAQPAAQLFDEGRALLSQGKAAEACAKFEASLKLDPDAAGVLLNLGLCNVQQHKVATALRWFRKAEDLASAETMAEVETAAKQQIMTLSSLVPIVRVDAPAGETVTIDGAPVSDMSRMELDAGHHTAELAGQTQGFDVADDASHIQVVTLHGASPQPPPPPAPHRSVAPWIVGGLGAGLVAGSGVVSLVGRSKFNGTHDLATRQHWKTVVEYGGSAMFAVGAVALGAATWLYLRDRDDTIVAPMAAPDRVGIAVTGAF